jgi:DNA-binding NarL/FixJ family response regulator
MSISISNARATPVAAATTSAAPARSPQPQPAANAQADTVRLSEAQQVYQLYNQGQAISQIASTLNLTVSAVNVYLGVTGSGS